jgi:hypothetical protein
MYSEAFRADRASVRIITQIPALQYTSQIKKKAEIRSAYSIPRLRPQATVIISLVLHVEIPDNEPRDNREDEVHSDIYGLITDFAANLRRL